MGVGIQIENLNNVFETSLRKPIILNDISEITTDQRDKLNELIYTTYTTDLLSNVPSCKCGRVTGKYNTGEYNRGEHNLGTFCEHCGTYCTEPQDGIEIISWLAAPNGVRAFVNPTIWSMLVKYFNKDRFSVIHWLTDPYYKSDKRPGYLAYIEEQGFSRGMNYFYDHFDEIMDCLFEMKVFKKAGKLRSNTLQKYAKKDSDDDDDDGDVEDVEVSGTVFRQFLTEYRDCVFTKYLPVPNKALMVIEENNSGTFADPTIMNCIDAARTIIGIDSPINNYSTRTKESRTSKCNDQMAVFYEDYYKKSFAKKEGTFRKHVYGNRTHFGFRTVISSITDPHDYDEIYIPWGVAINVLELHISNKLLRRGFTPNQIKELLYNYAHRYHPLLDEIFKELIAETPGGRGIHCVMVRNPSLQRGSCQALRITKVKIGSDQTTSISILICRNFNAD